MTEKQRLKHERDNHKVGPLATLIGSERDIFNMKGFREPKTPPRLSWLNAKTHSGFANRKCLPGRKPEHLDAVYEYSFAKETTHATGPDLQDHQRQVLDVATRTPQA